MTKQVIKIKFIKFIEGDSIIIQDSERRKVKEAQRFMTRESAKNDWTMT